MGSTVAIFGAFQAASPSSSGAARPTLTVIAGERSAIVATISSTAPASNEMKTSSVSTVPRYLPTRYSQRWMGRARMG